MKKVIKLVVLAIVLSCFLGCKSTDVKNDSEIEWRPITMNGFQPSVGSYDCITTSKTELLEKSTYGIDLWYKTITQNENVFLVISDSKNDNYYDDEYSYNEFDNDEYDVNITRISREIHILYEFVSEQTYKTYSSDLIKQWGKENCVADDKKYTITVLTNEIYSELESYDKNNYNYNYSYSKFLSGFSPTNDIVGNSYMECINTYYTDFKENYKVVNDVTFTDLETIMPYKVITSTVFKIQK